MLIPKIRTILHVQNCNTKGLKIVRNWVVSTSTILVKDLKNSLRHNRQTRAFACGYPECFARMWTKLGGDHPQSKLLSIFITSIDIHLQRFLIGFKSGEQGGWSRRRTSLAWKESFDLRAVWIAALSCWKIQSLHKRTPSVKNDDLSNMLMYSAAFWRPCTTCSSIVALWSNSYTRECIPHYGRKSPVGYR